MDMQNPNEKQDYIVNSDGWVAGKYQTKDSVVSLTPAAAKYEKVTLKSEAGPKVELTGSLDDPLVKKSGLAAKAKAETAKRNVDKK